MDEAVIRYYRRLLRTRFEHAGSFENPSFFVDSVAEQFVNCGTMGNYMQLYVRVVNNTIEDIRYLCSCPPASNVAVEILCDLVKGKTLDEAADVERQAFFQFLGSESDELGEKAEALLELLKRGISRYKNITP
jgi:NifU-like protein involved in Fe-S cluster formation